MATELALTVFRTVPTLVFQRLHGKKTSPLETRMHLFATPTLARQKAAEIERDRDLQLVAIVDALLSEDAAINGAFV